MSGELDPSQSTTLLPFMKEFDGTQPDISNAGLADSCRAFIGFKDKILADHESEVMGRGSVQASLYLETPAAGDTKEGWFLSVKENSNVRPRVAEIRGLESLIDKIPVAERTLASVTVGRRDKAGEQQKATYRLDGEGIVRRYDEDDVAEKIRMRRREDLVIKMIGRQIDRTVFGNKEPIEGEKDYAEASLEQAAKDKELNVDNRRMEREMRLNDFPVDPSELAALKEWIDQQPFQPWDLKTR